MSAGQFGRLTKIHNDLENIARANFADQVELDAIQVKMKALSREVEKIQTIFSPHKTSNGKITFIRAHSAMRLRISQVAYNLQLVQGAVSYIMPYKKAYGQMMKQFVMNRNELEQYGYKHLCRTVTDSTKRRQLAINLLSHMRSSSAHTLYSGVLIQFIIKELDIAHDDYLFLIKKAYPCDLLTPDDRTGCTPIFPLLQKTGVTEEEYISHLRALFVAASDRYLLLAIDPDQYRGPDGQFGYYSTTAHQWEPAAQLLTQIAHENGNLARRLLELSKTISTPLTTYLTE